MEQMDIAALSHPDIGRKALFQVVKKTLSHISVQRTEVVAPQPKKPFIAVIGVGFVGAGLVGSFSSAYEVLGYDISQSRIKEVEKEFAGRRNITFTTQESKLSEVGVFLISVPTLLRDDKSIDLSYLENALGIVERRARPGSTVVIESSVAVGHTRKLLGPLLQSKKMFGGMSPERIDPGRTEPPMHTIPKVISGLDDIMPRSLEVIKTVYSRVFDNLVPVSSPEVAEMVKLYENSQRMVCIAYANEMADACLHHEIDPFEVSQAAATKPFGFLPCYPSVGVGGHCIPVNPHYLLSNSQFPILEEAAVRMHARPAHLAERISRSLSTHSKTPGSAETPINKTALVVGVGFKAGQSHLVNSPGVELARGLREMGVRTTFADPLVDQSALPDIPRLPDEAWSREKLEEFDIIVVCHRAYSPLQLELLDELQNVQVQRWYC